MTSFKRWFGAGAIVLVALALVACPALVPKATGQIGDMTFEHDGGPQKVTDLGRFFDDDQNAKYSAASAPSGVVETSVEGTTLTVTRKGEGTTTVTVTADVSGRKASQSFTVTVKPKPEDPAPTNIGEIADMQFAADATDPRTVELEVYFKGAATYSATSTDEDVATESVEGATLTVTPVGPGNANVIVTATNDSGSVSQTFSVMVAAPDPEPENLPPVIRTRIGDMSIQVGMATKLTLADYYLDLDTLILTYTATSDDPATAMVDGPDANSVITITAVAAGTATITVSATDRGVPLPTTVQTFMVTVTETPPEPPDNRRPILRTSNPIEPVSAADFRVGDEMMYTLSNHFLDPDGDTLTYTAEALDESVASVTEPDTAGMFTLTAEGVGSTSVTVMASDQYGASAQQTFMVGVGSKPPTLTNVSNVVALVLRDGYRTQDLDLNAYFSDPEDDALTFAIADMGDANIATVTGPDAMGMIKITAVDVGETMVEVTAADSDNGPVSLMLDVTVSAHNYKPQVDSPIEDQSLVLDFDEAMKTVNVMANFSDMDSGPSPLMYSASSSDMNVVTASANGSIITITAEAVGMATITVTASDGADSVDAMFDVTVTAPPVPTLKKEIPNPTLMRGATQDFTLADYFNRATGYTAMSNNEAVVTATVSDDQMTLTLIAVGLGSAEVDITPSNSGGNGATESINVTVEGTAPAMKTGMMFGAGRVTVVADDGNGPDEEFTTEELEAVADATERYMLRNYVTDPDGDDTMLTFSTATSDNNVVAVYATPATAVKGFLATGGDEADRVDVTGMEHLGNPTDAQLRATMAEGADITIRGRSEGTARITVTARDADGLTSSWDFVITVVSVNRAPTINTNLTAFPGDVIDTATNVYGDFAQLDNERRFKFSDIASGTTKTLKIDLSTMFADLDRVIDADRHTGDPWTFEAFSNDTDVVTVALVSTNNPEKHDEYNVVVTPVGSGDASIYFVVTDSFGESFGGETPATDDAEGTLIENTFFDVKVNHVPEANGGQEENPLTLGANTTYRNRTVGEALPDLDLLDTGNAGAAAYFSDEDEGDTLLCRFNMRGDAIFGHQAAPNENEPTRPSWVSGSERVQIDFPATVRRGTAMLDVWCWDQVGTTGNVGDFEESPMATLTIEVRYDQSIQ